MNSLTTIDVIPTVKVNPWTQIIVYRTGLSCRYFLGGACNTVIPVNFSELQRRFVREPK